MNQSPQNSPSRLRKQVSVSSKNLNRSKVHLPSRYAQQGKPEKSAFHDMLNSIQSQIHEDISEKQKSPQQKFKIIQNTESISVLKKNNSSSQFKSRPMKRQDNQMIQFKQIFLNPRQQTLNAIKKLSQPQQNAKTITKQYQKILKFERGEEANTEQNQKLDMSNIKQSYSQAIQMLESEQAVAILSQKNDKDFYNSQITIQVPNMNSAAGIISGVKNNPPSLPPNYKVSKQLNLKELLLRAKAGSNSDDIEKQAHLSFYLGEVYSQKQMNKQALKFYRRFLGIAKIMEDRIGMAVGANRVAIAYYQCKDFEKSIAFHNQNLKLSADNCFIAYYNLGTCYRKLRRHQLALQYFQNALSWAQEHGQQQSQCIALGQIAVTYRQMELFQQCVQKFQQSIALCQKIGKKALKFLNLWEVLRVSSMLKIKSNEQLIKIAEQAFEGAKQLGQLSSLDSLRCNIGILKGGAKFNQIFDRQIGKNPIKNSQNQDQDGFGFEQIQQIE